MKNKQVRVFKIDESSITGAKLGLEQERHFVMTPLQCHFVNVSVCFTYNAHKILLNCPCYHFEIFANIDVKKAEIERLKNFSFDQLFRRKAI